MVADVAERPVGIAGAILPDKFEPKPYAHSWSGFMAAEASNSGSRNIALPKTVNDRHPVGIPALRSSAAQPSGQLFCFASQPLTPECSATALCRRCRFGQ